MNKKTVYDQLLNYKIQEEDLKVVTEIFIALQKQEIKILLVDLIKLFNKKIDLPKFSEFLFQAKKANVEIPIQKLITCDLSKDDLLSVAEGALFAGQHNLNATFEEFIYYAKNKISCRELLQAMQALHSFDSSIVFSDFKKSNFFLYSPSQLAQAIQNMAQADDSVLAREIIFTKILPSDIEEILRLYATTKKFNTKITAGEMLSLFSDGINIKHLIEAVAIAEKNNLHITFADIVRFEKSESCAIEVITHSITPQNFELDPVKGITQDGVEVVAKFVISTISDLNNYAFSPDFLFFLQKVKQCAVAELSKYSNYNSVTTNLTVISENIKNSILKTKNAYTLLDIIVKDTDIGKDIAIQLEITKLEAQQRIAEQRAKIIEAKLREKLAMQQLEGMITQNSHSGHASGNKHNSTENKHSAASQNHNTHDKPSNSSVNNISDGTKKENIKSHSINNSKNKSTDFKNQEISETGNTRHEDKKVTSTASKNSKTIDVEDKTNCETDKLEKKEVHKEKTSKKHKTIKHH